VYYNYTYIDVTFLEILLNLSTAMLSSTFSREIEREGRRDAERREERRETHEGIHVDGDTRSLSIHKKKGNKYTLIHTPF